ncbi:prophage PSSB64-02, partial [Halomonas sp. S2151]
AAGNEYTFELPEIEIDGELPDGGNEDIVQVSLNYTAKNTPIKVTRSLA